MAFMASWILLSKEKIPDGRIEFSSSQFSEKQTVRARVVNITGANKRAGTGRLILLRTENWELSTENCSSVTLSRPRQEPLRHGRKDTANLRQPHPLGSVVSLLRVAGLSPLADRRRGPFCMAAQRSSGIDLPDRGGCGNRGLANSHVLAQSAGPGDSPGRTPAPDCAF